MRHSVAHATAEHPTGGAKPLPWGTETHPDGTTPASSDQPAPSVFGRRCGRHRSLVRVAVCPSAAGVADQKGLCTTRGTYTTSPANARPRVAGTESGRSGRRVLVVGCTAHTPTKPATHAQAICNLQEEKHQLLKRTL